VKATKSEQILKPAEEQPRRSKNIFDTSRADSKLEDSPNWRVNSKKKMVLDMKAREDI
jgi:hypothetical protein